MADGQAARVRVEEDGVDEGGMDKAGGVEVVFGGVGDERGFWLEVLEEEVTGCAWGFY